MTSGYGSNMGNASSKGYVISQVPFMLQAEVDAALWYKGTGKQNSDLKKLFQRQMQIGDEKL